MLPRPLEVMIALMLGTLILALTYGAFWHGEPARRQNQERERDDSRFGRLLTRVLAWLLLMPHLSYSVEQKECVLPNGKGVEPGQAPFLRQVCAMPGKGTRNGSAYPRKSDVVPCAVGRNNLWERIGSALVPVLARTWIRGG